MRQGVLTCCGYALLDDCLFPTLISNIPTQLVPITYQVPEQLRSEDVGIGPVIPHMRGDKSLVCEGGNREIPLTLIPVR
jgi:hypothetical protein